MGVGLLIRGTSVIKGTLKLDDVNTFYLHD